VSPIRPSLYRSARRAVICALLALSLVQIAGAQLARKAKRDKGPRALGLLELSPDGKARLIPIAIMIDGKFYDAGAYKASPVPLALWGETVYEAERTGVSQGLFTVGDAIKAGNSWFGDGTWRPAGSEPKKHADKKPKLDDEDDGPPRLRRPDSEKSKGEAPPSTAPDAKAAPSSAPATTAPATTAPAPAPQIPSKDDPAKVASGEEQSPTTPTAPGDTTTNDEDPNRPVLARGKIETLGSTQRPAKAGTTSGAAVATKTAASKAASLPAAAPSAKTTQLIPAISDAGGPDPRPYAYDLKPDEEQKFRKKMLAMAADQILARAKPVSAAPILAAKPAARPGTPPKHLVRGPQPVFDDVQFHAFDLCNNNEPVFDLTYYITLVVKEDIYGDLRKLNSTITDSLHLDQTPRLELIDAVDADGDGRGELLFRQISDAGTAWGVYRAGADQLFPLFEGTP
jgi:hypothetical protein